MAVDDLSQDFLRVLLEYGGEADTTTIRSETGMSRGQVNHRYRKLDELEWIEIERADTGAGNRTPPKVAVLTEEGEQAIRSGDAGSDVLGKEVQDEEDDSVTVSKEQLENFNEEIDGMKNQLNVVVKQLNDGQTVEEVEQDEQSHSGVSEERVQNLEREVSRLRETVELLNQSVSEQRKKEVEEKKEQENEMEGVDMDMVQELRDEQAYLKDWMDVAERHMTAMRLFMQDNDVDMQKYFEMADDMDES